MHIFFHENNYKTQKGLIISHLILITNQPDIANNNIFVLFNAVYTMSFISMSL